MKPLRYFRTVAMRSRASWRSSRAGAVLLPLLANAPTRPCDGCSPGRVWWRWNQAKLLEHRKPVEHQIERDMLAVPEAEHLDISDSDGATGRWNFAHRAFQYAVVGACERAFLNSDIV